MTQACIHPTLPIMQGDSVHKYPAILSRLRDEQIQERHRLETTPSLPVADTIEDLSVSECFRHQEQTHTHATQQIPPRQSMQLHILARLKNSVLTH